MPDTKTPVKPWSERERTRTVYGRVRRQIAEDALAGRLPDDELRARHEVAQREYLEADAAWQAERRRSGSRLP
jgi:hypothetical protein